MSIFFFNTSLFAVEDCSDWQIVSLTSSSTTAFTSSIDGEVLNDYCVWAEMSRYTFNHSESLGDGNYKNYYTVDKYQTEQKPACTDTPPDGWLLYPKKNSTECEDYVSPLTDKFANTGSLVCSDCYSPPWDSTTCVAPKVLVPSDIANEPPTCVLPALTCDKPNQILNSDSTACICKDGTIDYLDRGHCLPDADGDGIPEFPNATADSDADGTPDIQDPDSPFYGMCLNVDSYATPTFYGKQYSLNYYDYFGEYRWDICGDKVDTGNTGLTYVDGSYDLPDKNPSCVLKYCYIHNIDKKYFKTNPCDEKFDRIEPTCGDDEVIIGYDKCEHNGIDVYTDFIKCVKINDPKSPDVINPSECDNNWYESYNSVTKSCMCDDGYSRNKWGNCTETLDSNATAEQIRTKEEQDKNDAVTKKNLENNTSFTTNVNSSSDSSFKNAENTLSGIRQDLNNTNKILGNISKKLDSNSDSNTSSTAFFNDGIVPVKSFLNDLKTDVSSVMTSFNSTKDFISHPFSLTLTQHTCKPFKITAFGRTVDLDLYNMIGMVRPALTFILTVIIYFLSIKTYIYALGLKND